MAEPRAPPARLLVSVPSSPELRSVVARALPLAQVAFVGPGEPGPWPEVEAWLVGSIPRELPTWEASQTPRLRFVQRLFTGLDGFPFERFPESVSIAGNVGAYAPYVAEHAVALLLAVTHNVVPNWEKVRVGRLRPPVSNRYLEGRTLLILGYGEIGRAVASRLAPFGMRVEGLTRTGRPEDGLARTYAATELLLAVRSADVVIDCRPLTDATRGTIGADALGAMRPEAVLVNVGRAATVDPSDLFDHLTKRPEFRAAFDVWWEEDFERGQLRQPFPFETLPNFLGSPHVAGIGPEPRARAIGLAVENLGRYFAGETPRHLADRAEYRRDR